MSFSGELEKLPQVREDQEARNLLERAFSGPEIMVEVIMQDVSSGYDRIVQEYPYLADRALVIPPTKRDLSVTSRLLRRLEAERSLTDYVDDSYYEKPHIVEEPAEVPTFISYVGMLRRYWNTDGCGSCGFCENDRYGSRTVQLIKHQSKVFYATQALARIAADDALVQIADMSILDGLETYALTRAIEVNRYLPRTIARLEDLIAHSDYVPFNAFDESVRFAGPKMAGVSIMNTGSLREMSVRVYSDSKPKQPFGSGSFVGERLAQFKPQVPAAVSAIAYEYITGGNPIPYVHETSELTVDAAYAIGWLNGYADALGEQFCYSVKPRMHPDVYSDDLHSGVDYSWRNASYALAYSSLDSPEEAWLHLIDIDDKDLRMKTALQLADAGNEYAFRYVDEHTKKD
jgi:hypothetical protein